jgi:ribokinase
MALHLDGSFGDVALQAAETVKSAGGRVMLDTGSPKPGIEELLRVADVVNAPRRFIEEFCGVSDLLVGARTILERGAKLVTVTDGEAGAVMGTEAGTWHVSALPVPRVIDTNGAGDVFSAGIIHGVLCGWAAERTLRFASALAGMKCAALGNRATPRAEQPAQLAADKLVVVDLCR